MISRLTLDVLNRSRVIAAIAMAGLGSACGPSPAPSSATPWTPLFNGTSLENWSEAKYSQAGRVRVEDDGIILHAGAPLTGVVYAKDDFPRVGYELTLEATKLEGNDFFCGLTAPYNDSHFTLILGGWSGEVTGISNIDDTDASQNETNTKIEFETNKPYKIRIRVTDGRIEAWIDNRKISDVEVKGRKISLRPGEIMRSRPLGVSSYFTKARIRGIRYRTIKD